MRTGAFIGLAVFAYFLCGASSNLGQSSTPEWLRGDWAVSKIYEVENIPYPESDAEPRILFDGKKLHVGSDDLELVGRACQKVTVTEEKRTFIWLIQKQVSDTLQSIGLKRGSKPVTVLDFSCGKSFASEDTEDTLSHENWYIVPVDATHIEMPFFYGSYLELHKVSGPDTSPGS